jgi:hypothetical protein
MAAKINARFVLAIKQLFLQQARALWVQITPEFVQSRRRVNLTGWATDAVIDSLVPFLLRDTQIALKEAAGEMAKAGRSVDTRVLREEIIDEAREQIRQMIRETAKTTARALNARVTEARRKMKKGLPGAMIGIQAEIENRLKKMDRFEAIAAQQTQQAKNYGTTLVYEQGGAKGKKWMADGPRACKACLALNGKVVGLNEPFYVDPKGGPYAVKMNPPFHPHCFCHMKFVLRRRKA